MLKSLSIGMALAACCTLGSARAATQFYVGAQGGLLSSQSDVTIPAYPSKFKLESTGGEAGAFAGIDFQRSEHWSIGFEADWNWTNADGTHLSHTSGPSTEKYAIDQNWNASIRALIGYTIGETTRLFGEAGFKRTNVDTRYIPGPIVKTVDLDGYVLGLGIGDMIDANCFYRAEYRYSHTGSERVVHGGPSDVDIDTNEVLLSVGYIF